MDFSILEKFSKEEISKIIEALDSITEKNKKDLQPELVREIEPIEKWVNNPYYVGKDGLKLFGFWKDALIEIFGTHKGQYNEIIIEGGLGCRPVKSYITTSIGKVTYDYLFKLPSKELRSIYITSDVGNLPIESINSVGKQKTLVIEFLDGYKFVCTQNHKLRILRDDKITWIEAKSLKKGDKILRSYRKIFYGNNAKSKNNSCYWYLIGALLCSSIYEDKDLKLKAYLKVKDKNVIKKIKNILNKKHIKNGLYENDVFVFDASSFHKEIHDLGIRINRPCSFGISLFNSSLFFNNKKLTGNWRRSLLCGVLDFAEFINKENTACRIQFYSEILAREIQSLFFEESVPCYIYSPRNNKHYPENGQRAFSFESFDDINDYSLKTFVEFKDYMAIKSLCDFDISNTKFIKKLFDKREIFENGKILHSSLPIPTGGLYNFSNDLKKYVNKHNLQLNKKQISLINRGFFNTAFLDWFKADGIDTFDSDIVDYISDNKCLNSTVISVKEGQSVECCDITVSGNPVYINDSIINHNCGKSTVGMFILIRKLYELSCYKNIPALFDLMASANIVFMYFSLTKQQAEATGFSQFRETVDAIPYFQECFCRNLRHSSVLEFPEHVIFRHGARLTDQIGSNLIATIMDEANFFNHDGKATADVGDLSAIQILHTSVLNRGASRFMSGGVNNSISVLISSPTYSSSYTQKRIEASIGNPHARVFRCRLWDCKPDKYSKETFQVFLGNEKVDPFIINDVDDLNNALEAELCEHYHGKDLKEGLATMPPRMKEKIDYIPIDFRPRYDQDLLQSIMDISGYSVAPTGRLFSSRKIWNQCVSSSIPVLFTKNELYITTEDDSERNTLQYYLKDKFPEPHLSHYIHIDQSYAHDCTGFSICHRGLPVQRNGSMMPTIILDCALRIKPPAPPKKISISRIRSFIFYCIKELHLNIAKVTYDSFSSAESIQTLKENGINAEMQSVDRTDEAYLGFIDLLYDGRILFNQIDADLMATEIFELMHYRERHKVDHQPNGCFSGQTPIKVLGEGSVAICELEGRQSFKTLGIDENNKIIEVPISKVWRVKKEDKVTKVRMINMDDGQASEVVCTRNHLFRLKNGLYIEARNLEAGMYLSSINNFVVLGIMNYTLIHPIYVYDMESPLTSNYCLGNGVFVHNSKDVMDAVVGCVHSAIEDKDSEFQTPSQLSAGLKGNYDSYLDSDEIFSEQELLSGYSF